MRDRRDFGGAIVSPSLAAGARAGARVGAALALSALLAVAACAQGAPPSAGPVRFPPPGRPVSDIVSPQWKPEFVRDSAHEAERVFQLLEVKPGVRVADVGAGVGYYTVRLAERVGPGTTVVAQEINAVLLDGLRKRLARDGIANVRLVLGTQGDPRLDPGSVDLVLVSHLYHEITQPYEFLWRLQPAFATGGRLAIIDMDNPTDRHGTPPDRLRCELAAVGYRQVAFHALAPADGYLAVFAAPAERPAPSKIRGC